MKKAGIAIILILLVASTAASVLFFQQKKIQSSKMESKLTEVKQAFEERGRLLDNLKKDSDNAKTQAKEAGDSKEKAEQDLNKVRTESLVSKGVLDKLVVERDALSASLDVARKDLGDIRNATESGKETSQKELVDLKQKLADLESLENQLKQANGKLKKLQNDFIAATTELDSQKKLLEDKRASMKEYEALKISPSQIRRLLDENARLRKAVSGDDTPPVATPLPIIPVAPKATLKTLPLGLKLPSPSGRLSQPLKPKNTPQP
jgi:chromosome segregation ATPase